MGKSQEFTRGHYESTSERGAYWILRWWTSDIDKHFVLSNADKAFSKNVFYVRGCTVWASYTPFFSLIKDLTCLLLASIQHSKLHWTFTRRQPEKNAFPETLTKLKTVLDILFSTFLNVKVIQWLLFSDIFIIREKNLSHNANVFFTRCLSIAFTFWSIFENPKRFVWLSRIQFWQQCLNLLPKFRK